MRSSTYKIFFIWSDVLQIPDMKYLKNFLQSQLESFFYYLTLSPNLKGILLHLLSTCCYHFVLSKAISLSVRNSNMVSSLIWSFHPWCCACKVEIVQFIYKASFSSSDFSLASFFESVIMSVFISSIVLMAAIFVLSLIFFPVMALGLLILNTENLCMSSFLRVRLSQFNESLRL